MGFYFCIARDERAGPLLHRWNVCLTTCDQQHCNHHWEEKKLKPNLSCNHDNLLLKPGDRSLRRFTATSVCPRSGPSSTTSRFPDA